MLFSVLALAVAQGSATLAQAESTPAPSQPTATTENINPFNGAVTAAKKSMAGAPATALEHAQKAEDLVAQANVENALETTLWLQGEALTRLNRLDEAQPIIARAIDLLGDSPTKLAADLLLSQGRLQRNKSQEDLALASFQSAYSIFEELGEKRSQALALQSIGTLYDSAHQYQRVIEYYQRASEIYSDGAILDLVSLNNRANSYRELQRYDEAQAMLEQAFEMAKSSGSHLLQARVLTNMSILAIRRRDFDAAQRAIEQGFEHVKNEDAKGWAPFLWGARAELALNLGRIDEASMAIAKTFAGMDLAKTPAPFRDFHEDAYKIYEAKGDFANALAHLAAFKRIDDQGRDVAASANLALMNAEFEASNKELEIQTLRADQLESDAALRASKQRQERLFALSALFLVSGLVAFLVFAYRSARNSESATKHFNAELETKNTELRDTNIALEQANNAKLEFLAVTSHEIRTPLNAIIGLSDVVLNGNAIESKDREYLDMVNSAGKHLLSIVNDILDVSRIRSGPSDS